MSISVTFICFLFAVAAQPSGGMPTSVTLNNCLVALDEEAEVPAQEPGVLQTLPVKEGQQVKAGELLAKIDDILPQAEQRVASFKLGVAKEQANSDINVRYAKAAAKVAENTCLRDEDINKRQQSSVPQATVQQHLLEHRAAVLSIEKSEMEQRIAALQVKVSQAELDAAGEKVQRRQIISPLDGQVRKTYRHVGEWVQPSDPVLHVVRVNRLRVEGFVNISKFAPEEVDGRPVTIKVPFARGRTETFSGKIVFVDPLVQAGGEYLVRALIQNREENGQWLLRAGMDAEMTIQLK